MTVVFQKFERLQTERYDYQITALTGFKAICLPQDPKWDKLITYFPSLEKDNVTFEDRVKELVNFYSRIKTGDLKGFEQSEIKTLQEEFDHFECLRSSRLVQFYFYVNQLVRWKISLRQSKTGESFNSRDINIIFQYFRGCFEVFNHAYPLVEGRFLSKHPDDVRHSETDWHPLSKEVQKEAKAQSESKLSTKSIGKEIDFKVLNKRNMNWLALVFHYRKLLIALVDIRLATKLIQMFPQIIKFAKNFVIGRKKGSKESNNNFFNYPTLFALAHTFDTGVMAIGELSHSGFEEVDPIL